MLNKRKKIETRNRNRASNGRLNLVGAKVRDLRRKFSPKMTQDDLAGRVAANHVTLDRTAIYRIETGARAVTDIELRALARALKVSVQELFPAT